ncbi:MAG: hypothetical protein B6D37_02610 [Sphingobacteriales bacterium UTBCD1]|jgi:hypothetical protein|nr:MAG: hypothetical protein B6D37_02610 [Sphingobacteriales bacterium UTBCD1]
MKPCNKILGVAVIVLFLVNAGLLLFIWKGKGSGHAGQKPDSGSAMETMARELNMTESQKKNYQTLRDQHFAGVRPLYDSVREIRKEFLKMIQSLVVQDSSISNYSRRIAEKQAVIDRLTLDHFRKVRGLFSGEQQKQYDDFIQKIMLRRRDSSGKR